MSNLSRSSREQRAFQLVVAGGLSGTVAVVTLVLAIVGIMSLGIPVLAILIAVACYFLFRRTVVR